MSVSPPTRSTELDKSLIQSRRKALCLRHLSTTRITPTDG
ncbi:hypothetical protein GFS60_06819 (plasmid) [Rhodococcus sp. WAY2]|nr:hypothetical protein GFS60_06819 [Rhodococcus sp. WAY2]